MSRAFVCDGASDATDDEAPEIKIPIPAGSRNYLTPEGAARLASELSSLETLERPRLALAIDSEGKGTPDQDTMSTLRRALAKMDRRIEYLSRMAAIAATIEPPPGGYPRVAFGATVRVTEPTGASRVYRIVGVDEADPDAGLIGWTSPVAKALIGHVVGDTTTVRLPEGTLELYVEEIS
ncbi:MAG: GreA/GreB family elongation factor [Spirochaetales bacterium]|nr:GreA/GreB family elongation factor [Spirochaetales bacterium]